MGGACTGTGTVGGFTCTNNLWATAGAAVAGGTCTGTGTQSGSLFCNGTTWITQPTVGGACTGTGTVGGFTCTNNLWATAGAAVAGGTCTGTGTQSGSLFCNGSIWVILNWTMQPTLGGACTGTGTVGNFYCNGASWAAVTPGSSGGTCTGTSAPAGNFGCNAASNTWVAFGTLGTPGLATPPAASYMHDAFGTQILIPAGGYRNVGYLYATAANATAMEISVDNQIVSPGGWSTYFSAPSSNGTATSSINTTTFTMGATQMDSGYDPVSGLTWGRWQGNWVTNNPTQGNITASASSNLHWFASPTQTQAITLPITGTFKYTPAGGTTPTDNYGTLGSLTSATFNADFSAQKVNMSIGVSMPASGGGAAAVQMNATANNVPILPGANFKTTTPTVTCTGCTGALGGVIGGQFSQGGIGVGVGYGLTNGPQVIGGAVVFHK